MRLKKSASVWPYLLVLVLVLMACGKEGANATLAPYPGEPPEIPLSDSEKSKLDRGESVDKVTPPGDGTAGRAVKVFRVDAPPNIVGSVILDFEQYPHWIKSLTETKIYKRQGDNIFVEFHLYGGFMVGTYVYHINHNCPILSTGWCTWKLDESPGIKNDIKGSVGFWRVKPLPNSDGKKSEITYSIDVDIGGIANLIRGILVDKGLKEATEWVKKQSEDRYRHHE